MNLRYPVLRALLASSMCMSVALATLAAPGAHGPDGEHLDGPAGSGRRADASPKMEAKSEAFELVATLSRGELSVLIDRFETNEPVLDAKVEVESGALKAVAAFRAEQGDYVVTDAAMFKALAAPGEHGLVFTLAAGKDSDLLDGTLVSALSGAAAVAVINDHGHAHGSDDHGHDHELERAAWIAAGVAVLGLIGGIAWWRRRRDSGKLQGAL